MARKKTWFNPNDGCTVNRNKNSHVNGRQKNMQCQTTKEKLLLCKARSYKNISLYLRWDEFFSKI